MFQQQTVSVVMPAYNEEENISKAVRDFLTNEYVDEVVVADNNSSDKTADKAEKAGAKVVEEMKQGYGFSCRRALREATCDLIVLVEPDGTFTADDLIKLLAYSNDFDFILGTRTSSELIWEGANMDWFLKWGNWVLGKLIMLLYNGPALTDVGCTYRLIRRSALERIQGSFTVGGSHFSPEMIILAIKNKVRTIEVPVNYLPRKGTSKITGERWKAFKLGLIMTGLILSKRLR